MQKSALQILIELVDSNPSDEAVLNEIDARVWCYKMGFDFVKLNSNKTGLRKFTCNKYEQDGFKQRLVNSLPTHRSYTRSRDALLQLRKPGWFLNIIGQQDGTWKVDAISKRGAINGEAFATEQMAELRTAINILVVEGF